MYAHFPLFVRTFQVHPICKPHRLTLLRLLYLPGHFYSSAAIAADTAAALLLLPLLQSPIAATTIAVAIAMATLMLTATLTPTATPGATAIAPATAAATSTAMAMVIETIAALTWQVGLSGGTYI